MTLGSICWPSLQFGPGTDAYNAVLGKRGELMAQIGRKFPRIDFTLSAWEDFSPKRARAWFDPEFGFVVETRIEPTAPSAFKRVTAEEAAAVIRHELTPEQEERLFEPDEYIGE
ncbi:hypothetical protein ES708_24207 [subsurface metagenome]